MYNLHRLALLDELDRRGTLAAVAQALSFAPTSGGIQVSVYGEAFLTGAVV